MKPYSSTLMTSEMSISNSIVNNKYRVLITTDFIVGIYSSTAKLSAFRLKANYQILIYRIKGGYSYLFRFITDLPSISISLQIVQLR